jgi:hypothetical protein
VTTTPTVEIPPILSTVSEASTIHEASPVDGGILTRAPQTESEISEISLDKISVVASHLLTLSRARQETEQPICDNQEPDVSVEHKPGKSQPEDKIFEAELPVDMKFTQNYNRGKQEDESYGPPRATLTFSPRRQKAYLASMEDPQNPTFTRTGFPIQKILLTNDALNNVTEVYPSNICPKIPSKEAADEWEAQHTADAVISTRDRNDGPKPWEAWEAWDKRVMQSDPNWRPLDGKQRPQDYQSSTIVRKPMNKENKPMAPDLAVILKGPSKAPL